MTRYSNFHRARKWHRKFRNTLYDPDGVWIQRLNHREEKYHRYFEKAQADGLDIDHVGKGGDTTVLAIRGRRNG